MSTEHSPDEEIPEVLPVPEQQHPRPACSHCGGDHIIKGLKLSQTAEVGDIGVQYQATGKFLGIAILGTEPLRVDLCNACGTVTRFYVKNTKRKWS